MGSLNAHRFSRSQSHARADTALYDAKLVGRNRVVGAHAGLLTLPAIVTNGVVRALAV